MRPAASEQNRMKSLRIICQLCLLMCALASKWLEWSSDLTERPAEMSTKLATSLTKLIGTKMALFPSLIQRIDKYVIGNHAYYWAWHSGSCNGLSDPKWSPSNGHDMSLAMANDYHRLKLLGVIDRDGVAIDIGAHTGDSTIPMALLASKTIAFDPSASVFPILATNGEMKFEYGSAPNSQWECNGGAAGIAGRDKQKTWVTRPTANLQSFLTTTYNESIIQKISYIKVDAEGFDAKILESLIPMLTGMTIKPAIQIEYFLPFVYSNEADGSLSSDSRQIFDTIIRLPGQYTAYCTGQCNNLKSCNNNLKQIVLAPSLSSSTKITAKLKGSDENAGCDDIMLLPANFKPHYGHHSHSD